MTLQAIDKPGLDEYSGFYHNYIGRVDVDTVAGMLTSQPRTLEEMTRGLDSAAGDGRYAPGKWSIKEVVGHLCDTERIFAYRLLRIARGDTTPLPGFAQDYYVEKAAFGRRALRDLVAEFAGIRRTTLDLVRTIGPEELRRIGSASEIQLSARALIYAIAGHVDHHLAILSDRYGLGRPVTSVPDE